MKSSIKTFTIATNIRDNIKVWGAIIKGIDPKFGFKREFKSYRYLNDCSSSFGYFNYYIDANENDFIEIAIEKPYGKKQRKYYHLLKGVFIKIRPESIKEFYNVQKKVS